MGVQTGKGAWWRLPFEGLGSYLESWVGSSVCMWLIERNFGKRYRIKLIIDSERS